MGLILQKKQSSGERCVNANVQHLQGCTKFLFLWIPWGRKECTCVFPFFGVTPNAKKKNKVTAGGCYPLLDFFLWEKQTYTLNIVITCWRTLWNTLYMDSELNSLHFFKRKFTEENHEQLHEQYFFHYNIHMVTSECNVHVFRLWEDCGESPRRPRENTQALQRKALC